MNAPTPKEIRPYVEKKLVKPKDAGERVFHKDIDVGDYPITTGN